jgi:hypothetical protein
VYYDNLLLELCEGVSCSWGDVALLSPAAGAMLQMCNRLAAEFKFLFDESKSRCLTSALTGQNVLVHAKMTATIMHAKTP